MAKSLEYHEDKLITQVTKNNVKFHKKIKFQKADEGEFFDLVKKRVEEYFSNKKISPHANRKMYIKIGLLFTLYFLFLIGIYSNRFFGIGLITMYALLGFTISLICCNFGHDLLHGSYFKSQTKNKLLGYIYDINGLSSFMWRITHNIRHHIYTNIPGHDEDIDKAILLRLSPKDKVYPFHRYQHLYAFFLYFFSSLNWAYYSDFKGLYVESKRSKIPYKDISIFFLLKLTNVAIYLIIPVAILTSPVWMVVLGFIFLHFAGGFFSALIFQLAHVVENVSYPEPDADGNMQNKWAIHEMYTTSNFASGSSFWTWLTGGLNHQIEHHLFPHVCHIHYPKIHEIVKSTAKEFHIPYHEQPSFIAAVRSHYRTLKKFGS